MPRNGSGQYSAPTNSFNPAINGVPATAADWQAVLNDIVSAMTQSVSRDGQTAMIGNLPMAGNKVTGLGNATATSDALTFAQLFSQGQQQDVPAAATTDIGAALSTLVNVTGTGTINSFGTNYNGPRFLRFAGACTLTNSASLVVPGGANLTTAAGDSAIAVPLGNPATGWRVVVYERASGAAFDGSVTTNSIQDDAVTFAKMQNIPTGTILGRNTAGAGDVDALTAIPAGVDVPAARLSGDVAAARITNALNASGSAPIYACRAWVNFNGTGVVAIRASGNVSSITDNGVGDYTVNFTTAMPDANYCAVAMSLHRVGVDSRSTLARRSDFPQNASSLRLMQTGGSGNIDATFDPDVVTVAVFR